MSYPPPPPSSSSSFRKTAAVQGTTAVRGLSSATTSFSSSVSNSSGGGKQPTTTTTATYEQVKALSREALLPDKVSWNNESSYRGNSYRLLQHQNGIVGYLHMRLIEGQNLHLKQQRKQPPVSAYALIHLSHTKNLSDTYDPVEEDCNASTAPDDATTTTTTTSAETFRSSTVWDCTNPVWPVSSYYASSAEGTTAATTLDSTNQNNPHSSSNRPISSFRIPLRKGTIPEGSEALLNIRMQHDPHSEFSTSSSSSGGGAFGIFNIFHTNENLSLGRAAINVTKLLMGEEAILDVWVQLSDASSSTGSCILSSAAQSSGIGVEGGHRQDTAAKKLSSSKVIPTCSNSYGKVRILLSYEPEGLRPQLNDYVTFEAFARHPNNLIIHPITQPMKVVATRGEYLLLQFYYYSTSPNSIAIRRKEIPENRNEGRVRVHRNTIFVIERISFVDGVMDTILQPVDIVTQLPVVQEVGKALRPVTNVVTDLTMPAILSGKMFLAITKTAASAGITGVLTTVKVLAMATTAAANSKRD